MVEKKILDFELVTTGGGSFKLSAQRGKKVVVYFYPKDNTPGCTLEGQEFRDLYPAFQKANAMVVGISRDSVKSHEGFKSKQGFPFELLSDPDEIVCGQFGVMKLKNMYGKQVRGVERSTFVFDTAGKLAREWRGVKAPGHAAEVLAFVETL
ncbi:MAG TPA: peroxiredoxin [Thiobacillaceae bacterium]|nr:peroxiredoxin [Thiobacillaceae bacterium]